MPGSSPGMAILLNSRLNFRQQKNSRGAMRPELHPRSRVRFASKSMHTSILVQRKHSGLVWLTGRLMPDFKTIADFRKDDGEAIRKVGREFVVLCRRLELFSEARVAIDGSKFKAVNTRDRNFTHAKMQRRLGLLNVPTGDIPKVLVQNIWLYLNNFIGPPLGHYVSAFDNLKCGSLLS
jgi:hypothetical protein